MGLVHRDSYSWVEPHIWDFIAFMWILSATNAALCCTVQFSIWPSIMIRFGIIAIYLQFILNISEYVRSSRVVRQTCNTRLYFTRLHSIHSLNVSLMWVESWGDNKELNWFRCSLLDNHTYLMVMCSFIEMQEYIGIYFYTPAQALSSQLTSRNDLCCFLLLLTTSL